MRFTEEVHLLLEEMNRVLCFFRYQETRWKGRGDRARWPAMSDTQAEGLHAYAERQGALRMRLHNHFSQLWSVVPNLLPSCTNSLQ